MIYATKWYNFPPKEQMIVANILTRAQNFTELWIGPFMPLNFVSAQFVRLNLNIGYFVILLFEQFILDFK